MTLVWRRVALSAIALLLLAPGPLLAGWPHLAPWLNKRMAGIPIDILLGSTLIVALVLLAWQYASLSLDNEVGRD